MSDDNAFAEAQDGVVLGSNPSEEDGTEESAFTETEQPEPDREDGKFSKEKVEEAKENLTKVPEDAEDMTDFVENEMAEAEGVSEEVEDEEPANLGTDEQKVPNDPGEVTVSFSNRGKDQHDMTDPYLTISMPSDGGCPVVSFGNATWTPQMVNQVMGIIRRSFRMYQQEVRKQNG